MVLTPEERANWEKFKQKNVVYKEVDKSDIKNQVVKLCGEGATRKQIFKSVGGHKEFVSETIAQGRRKGAY